MLNLVKYVQQDAKIINVSLDNSSKENNWNMMLYNFVNDLKQSKEISGLNKNFDSGKFFFIKIVFKIIKVYIYCLYVYYF